MASSSRIFKAFRATRALGIPDEEVKPLLKHLLEVYDKNWELIEEDNYRTLLDSYFELEENKVNLFIDLLISSCFNPLFPMTFFFHAPFTYCRHNVILFLALEGRM